MYDREAMKAARTPTAGAPGPSTRGTVLIVCDFAAYQPGTFLAAQIQIGQAVRERLGLDYRLALPERAVGRKWLQEIEGAGFEYTFLPSKARNRVASLMSYALDVQARILHSHFTWFDLDCLYVGRRTGAAVIWHIHNGLAGYPIRQRLSDVLKARIMARGCEAVVACSEHVGKDALRRGFPAKRVQVVRNGLLLQQFGRPARNRAAVREQLGINPNSFLVLSFCWPPARKGTDVLLQALLRLYDIEPDRFAAVLVGYSGLRAYVESRLRTCPPWLSTIPPVEDVASLLGAVDVFVSAAREEGFSYAVGEAMASALPVVGSDIPGTSHFWDAPGFLRYPVEDPDTLCRRIREVMSSTKSQELGEQNQRWARSNLGIEEQIEATLGLYQRALSRNGLRSTQGSGNDPLRRA